MKSFTNRAQKWRGDTTSVTVRLPNPVVGFMDAVDHEVIRNRSEFLQHWAAVGTMVMGNPELAEALDWALSDLSPLPSILDVPMEPMNAPMVETMAFDSTPQVFVNKQADPLAETYDEILEKLRSKIH